MILPREWVRGPQWATASRAGWAPRLARAQAAWSELELLSLTEGVRGAALLQVTPAEMVLASRDCARQGLEVTPLEADARGLRVAVHRPGQGTTWRTAWAGHDDDTIGYLLGFPACCRAFFARTWAAGARDLTPHMSAYDGPWETSTALRWLGVRLVPHLPCSATCAPSLDLARAFLAAGARAGVDTVDLEALLRLPVTHSAVGGLAIIETPHFRVMASCDPETWTGSRAAQSAEWALNGFATAAAMEAAHAVVQRAAGEPASVLDLGCGDGALLARLRAGRELPFDLFRGVEHDATRAAAGARRSGVLVVRGRILEELGRMAHAGEHFDLVLLMPGRLLEYSAMEAALIRSRLRAIATQVLAYAYGDTLARQGGLAQLATAAGLEIAGTIERAPGVEAALATVAGGER